MIAWLLAPILAAITAYFVTKTKKPIPEDGISQILPPVRPQEPPTAELPPVASPTRVIPKVPLATFCSALKQFEGANPANNNPGNCRCSPVGYLSRYGKVTCNPHNFAVFQTYELGWEYLNEKIHHTIVLHPTWTFYDFFANWAPSTDGNEPHHYAEWVSAHCGQPATAKLSEVLN